MKKSKLSILTLIAVIGLLIYAFVIEWGNANTEIVLGLLIATLAVSVWVQIKRDYVGPYKRRRADSKKYIIDAPAKRRYLTRIK